MSKAKEKLTMRVIKGAIVPADDYTTQRLRDKGYKTGDLLTVTLSKQRSPGYNRLAHQLGILITENIDEFSGMDCHKALKRLQLESGVACELTAIKVPGIGMVEHRTAQSLSFDNMDEGDFKDCISGLCRHITKTYWPNMEPDQIESMLELMP